MRLEGAATLSEALGVRDRRVVAFTGGGGKTTAMFRLARELAAERVLVTTTTKIWVPRPDEAALVLADDPDGACERLRAGWARGVRALGTAVTPEGKLQGVPPEWVAGLRRAADRVLVEADGAAGKPLTAPRVHEPVIPPSAALVVPVAGVDAVGAALDDEHAHRVAEIAALTGCAPGGAGAAGWRAAGRGGGRGPAGCHGRRGRTMSAVAGLLLAAGTSSRLGQPKQLLPY